MEAWVLVLNSLETGRRLGMGLLCVDARYASIGWHGVDRFERLYATPQQWREIGFEIERRFPGHRPLPHDEPIGRLFSADRSDIFVHWLHNWRVPEGDPAAVVAALDRQLHSLKCVSENPPPADSSTTPEG